MAGENVLGNMVVRFTAETEGMREDIAAIKQQLGDMDEQTQASSLSMTELNNALEIGQKVFSAAGDILDGTVGKMIDYGMEVKDVASMLGVSTVEASTLIQVLDDLRIETSTLETSMRTMKENGMVPSMDTLKQLSAQYLTLEDPVARAQFLFDNFGRAGQDMIRAMEAGPDMLDELAASAAETGLVVGDDFVAQAEEGRQALDEMQDAWDGMVMKISSEIMPGLSAFVRGLTPLVGLFADMTAYSISWVQELSTMDFTLGDLVTATWNAVTADESLADTSGDAAEGMATLSTATWDAEKATSDYVTAATEQTETMPNIIDMAGDLAGKFDEQKLSADLVSSGINAMTDSYLEYERVMAVVLLAQGKINAEEFNHRMDVIKTLGPLEDLNAAYESGAISEYEWIEALSDGTVTQAEVNALLGITGDGLSKVAQLMLTLDGAVADASVNIDINTTGNARGSLGSDIGNVNVDMFMAEGGSFVATQPTVMMVGEAGPEYVNVTPADQAGAQGMTININDRLAMKLWMDQQAAADRERLNAVMG